VHGSLDARNLRIAAAELFGEGVDVAVAALDSRPQANLFSFSQVALRRQDLRPLPACWQVSSFAGQEVKCALACQTCAPAGQAGKGAL
jgi:hypothetical protein